MPEVSDTVDEDTRRLPVRLLQRLAPQRAPALPQRVRELIGAQEQASERLIGWAQLLVTITFASLYLLAPAPTDSHQRMLEPVPYALTGYGMFTLLRLGWSYLGRLPQVVVLGSIVADMGLLLGLIWSFHFQYGQPAAFSLKVPTFIYIFVFIALRALRFDPRYVLAAGVAAAVGWGVLVLMSLNQSQPGDVTRSFVAYLTSNHILLGAEFDKIFTLLLVTGILTFAVWRARRTLVSAVREETARRDIGRFLSKGLVETISGAEVELAPGTATERQVAVLMLDIRGFTGFSMRVPPRQVVEMLTGFHARILPIVQGHGGVVDKFLGDGTMVTFGAVKLSATPAADALRALEDVLAAAAEWSAGQAQDGLSAPLAVNGAVAAGPVVFAVLGSADRLEYTVIGEAVNLAAKLEKHNKAEGTRGLTSAQTYDLAVAQGYSAPAHADRRPARQVGGVAEPIDLVALG